MNFMHEIAEWASQLPSWQSDAVRRFVAQGDFTIADEDDLLAMLRFANGIVDPDNPPPEPAPFLAPIEHGPSNTRQIVLNELHSVVGVNALVPGQSIAFALEGLTIVYGENGAGKSGYSRVLKHACHAREQHEPIHANISENAPPEPAAIIELTVDGRDVAVHWTKGMPPSGYLAQIAVFDAHCARVFLDEANEVVYSPYGSALFPKLAELMKRLKERIRAQLSAIPDRLAIVDDFRAETVAGQLARNLSEATDLNDIDEHGRLTATEAERLAQLRALVGSLKLNPPKQQATELRRRKMRLEQLQEFVANIERNLSAKAAASLRELRAAAKAADRAAALASGEAFTDEPIKGTGSDAWRTLFEAAKSFSMREAYVGKDFPYLGAEAACVWCQQPLSPDAKDRLSRFQAFVIHMTARDKATANAAHARAMDSIRCNDVQAIQDDSTYVTDLSAVSEELTNAVEAYFAAAASRQRAILVAHETDDWDVVPELASDVSEILKDHCASLERSALAFDGAEDAESLRELETELAELADRERMHKYADDIKKHVAGKQTAAALRACDQAVDTTAITRFGSELIARAVTEQLERCLADELADFRVPSFPLRIKKSGEKGRTKHQLTIATDVRPSGILSEGEQRVVAIACFLAELAAAQHASPIVFDDPVSSLDHLYRGKIAARLVKEAARRQVVVFTHDVTLLLALERECSDQRVPLLVHTLRRSTNGPGECASLGRKPWHCQSINDRIGHLKQLSAPFKRLQGSEPDAFDSRAKDLYGKLRESWERAIEEVVLNGVIGRFDPAVQTKRLRDVCMEPSDYATIDREMSKCSTRFTGHDTAPALSLEPMGAEEIEADIKTLETFVKDVRDRQKKARKAADELVSPPAAKVASRRATRDDVGDGKLSA